MFKATFGTLAGLYKSVSFRKFPKSGQIQGITKFKYFQRHRRGKQAQGKLKGTHNMIKLRQ